MMTALGEKRAYESDRIKRVLCNCLKIVEVKNPRPEQNESWLKVRAAGINFAEMELEGQIQDP